MHVSKAIYFFVKCKVNFYLDIVVRYNMGARDNGKKWVKFMT
jgi:hypothetical protein